MNNCKMQSLFQVIQEFHDSTNRHPDNFISSKKSNLYLCDNAQNPYCHVQSEKKNITVSSLSNWLLPFKNKKHLYSANCTTFVQNNKK